MNRKIALWLLFILTTARVVYMMDLADLTLLKVMGDNRLTTVVTLNAFLTPLLIAILLFFPEEGKTSKQTEEQNDN